jgi:DNA polymerase I-like protein with 3'-5' exonuclease and polymerase domains
MKIAMVRLEQRLLEVPSAEQILQIHDSILVEVDKGYEKQVQKVATEVMTTVCPDLPVKFAVDVQIGANWRGL